MTFSDRVGPITLRVRDLDEMLKFYKDEMGLTIQRRDKTEDELDVLELGFPGASLINLVHDPRALAPAKNSAGLYHFAILCPDRLSLASTYLALGNSGIYFAGFADHIVSEALYLEDPESNGIEIYSDRPKETWKRDLSNNNIEMGSLPLDFNSLLSELSSGERKDPKPFPKGARIGHVHLKVTDIKRTKEFYEKTLGLDLMAAMPSAAFLSYDGYHHNVGMNTWESLHGPESKRGSLGLEYFTLKLHQEEIERIAREKSDLSNDLRISDPDNIQIKLQKM